MPEREHLIAFLNLLINAKIAMQFTFARMPGMTVTPDPSALAKMFRVDFNPDVPPQSIELLPSHLEIKLELAEANLVTFIVPWEALVSIDTTCGFEWNNLPFFAALNQQQEQTKPRVLH